MFIVKVGSVTNAQRAARALRSKGIKASISRIEKPSANDGCGYVIKLHKEDENEALRIIRSTGVAISGVEEL